MGGVSELQQGGIGRNSLTLGKVRWPRKALQPTNSRSVEKQLCHACEQSMRWKEEGEGTQHEGWNTAAGSDMSMMAWGHGFITPMGIPLCLLCLAVYYELPGGRKHARS